MSVQRDLIQKRLRDEGDKLLASFAALAPDQWSSLIYSDGMQWTLKDLLAHFISAEHEFLFYGRQIIAGGAGAPEDFDLNGFNQRAVASMHERDAEQLLADLHAVRQQTIDFVAELKDEDFACSGRHPVFEQMTVEEMFKLIYRHNMMHMRDVRRMVDQS